MSVLPHLQIRRRGRGVQPRLLRRDAQPCVEHGAENHADAEA